MARKDHTDDSDCDCQSQQGSWDSRCPPLETSDYYTYNEIVLPAVSSRTVLSRKRRRVVRFSAAIYADPVLSRYEYTPQEIQACWYTPKERHAMKKSRCLAVNRLESKTSPKRGHTYRGLETCSVQGALDRLESSRQCVHAVMDEQDRQWQNYHCEESRIATISMEMSHSSKIKALKTAQLDAQDATKDDDDDDIEDTASFSSAGDYNEAYIKAPASIMTQRNCVVGIRLASMYFNQRILL